MKRLVLVFAGVLFLSLPAYADVYRWVDENGIENFTDAEWNIPEKYRKKAVVTREKKTAPPSEAPAQVNGLPDEEMKKESSAPRGPLDNDGHDEAWWRGRVDALKNKKADLEKELVDIEAKIGQASDKARIAAMGRSAEQQQDQVKLLIRRDEIRKEIADIDYQLETGLPDEARRAGALPGWLR